jgi:hypothetical protein
MMRNEKSKMRSIFNLSRTNPKFQPHLSELKSFDIGNSLPLRYEEGPEVTLGFLLAIFGMIFFALGFISLIPSFLGFIQLPTILIPQIQSELRIPTVSELLRER